MRTLEQKVEFHLALVNKADAAHTRASLSVAKAKGDQTTGNAYAVTYLAEAEQRAATSPAMEAARREIEKAENKLAAAKLQLESAIEAHSKNTVVPAGLQYARNAVATTERKHTLIIETAEKVQRAAKAKLDAELDLYINAVADVESNDRKEIAAKLKANREEAAEEKVFQKHKAEQLARTVTQTDSNHNDE